MRDDLRLMTRAGKTFYFSTFWLSHEARNDAAVAYGFCRRVDDVADGALPQDAKDNYLETVARDIRDDNATLPDVARVLPLISRFPEVREPLAALVDACRSDTNDLVLRTEADLERYSFGVAGNVGLIMYPILGGHESHGRTFAAELGIAMQCTNIARDVREDLARGRIYIPSEWLGGVTLDPISLELLEVEQVVVEGVRRVLACADRHYNRALSGIDYLGPRSRHAIKVAARCYAAIGDRVLKNGRLARKRAVVPLYKKIFLACEVSRRKEPARQVLTCAE